MAELRLEDVIRRPLITEKNTWLMDQGQYSFEVHPDANKIQIKAAVQSTFSVTVKAVNTLNVKPKPKSRMIRRIGAHHGRHRWLEEGDRHTRTGRPHRPLRAGLATRFG
jgi:large subunit ribosomal protein L23